MKFLVLFLFCSSAWACVSPKPGLENKTVCRPSRGKSFDLSFGKALSLKAREVKGEMIMINTEFSWLELSGGEVKADFRDLHGKGSFSDLRIGRDSDLRFADLRGFRLSEVIIEASRLHGTNLKGVDLSRVEFINCDMNGAIFDLRTRLPFSVDEALEKGMIIK